MSLARSIVWLLVWTACLIGSLFLLLTTTGCAAPQIVPYPRGGAHEAVLEAALDELEADDHCRAWMRKLQILETTDIEFQSFCIWPESKIAACYNPLWHAAVISLEAHPDVWAHEILHPLTFCTRGRMDFDVSHAEDVWGGKQDDLERRLRLLFRREWAKERAR
jgi:hypothetical protein